MTDVLSDDFRLCLNIRRLEHEDSSCPAKQPEFLGTHGVPAAYGGFETAAENVALYLVKNGLESYCLLSGRW